MTCIRADVRSGWGLMHRELGLLGVFGSGEDGAIPPRLSGYRMMVYETRERARRVLRIHQAPERLRTDGWRYWLETRVVRVRITVVVA